ncbi:MAG: serine/threonine protein kinase [Gemmataceae bacterium]|nr:serine/threonine protein kinase [Gemmataceae bacterium]
MNISQKATEETTDSAGQLNERLRWDDSVRRLVIRELGGLPVDARLDWIRSDQRQRWLKGSRIPIEGYLELPPVTNVEPDLFLDLIYSEYILRQGIGEMPSEAEYLRRFPKLETELRRLFAVDQALLPVEAPRLHDDVAETMPCPAIGKYPILSVLAEGGQGVVYRALHPTLAKEVIVKWSKQTTNTARDRDHLLAEGRLLARIEHPNLVRVFDLDFHEGQPFLVMESVDGVNLEQYFDAARPGPKQAGALVARIALALEFVQRKGITHRDIKPRNILIDDKDQPKLIDFGIAQWTCSFSEPRTDSGFVSGTLAYISPEQADGDEANFGPRTDIFGLGGVLHYLLTGSAPYREKDVRALFQSAKEGNWDRTPLQSAQDGSIPARLRAICTRALAPDPKNRYASALEMAQALEAYAQRPRKIAWMSGLLGAAILACAVVGGLALRSPPVDSTLVKNKGVEQEPGTPRAPTKLAIDVVRDKRGPFALEDAVPIRTGNELRFNMPLPPDRFASLFHYSEGKWVLCHQFGPEESWRMASYPNAGERVPLLGKSGTEFFLFCARRQKPIDLPELQTIVGGADAVSRAPQRPGIDYS